MRALDEDGQEHTPRSRRLLMLARQPGGLFQHRRERSKNR